MVTYDRKHWSKFMWQRRRMNHKCIGILSERMSFANFDVIQAIFGYVHFRASHSVPTLRDKWKDAEQRMVTRFKKRV